jgi:hypothetical protein
MAWWQRKKSKPIEQRDISLQDLIMGANGDTSVISKDQAMQVPSLNGALSILFLIRWRAFRLSYTKKKVMKSLVWIKIQG